MPYLFFKWRENLRLAIYDNRQKILTTLRIIGMLVATTAIISILYLYGFPKTSESVRITREIIQASLLFYLIKYWIKLFLSLDWKQFIRQNLFESFIMFFLMIMILLYLFFRTNVQQLFQENLNMEMFSSYTVIFVQLYFFIIFALELGRGSRFIAKAHIGPAQLLALSFVLLITMGTILLLLPEMTTSHHISLIDAIFTATSASCVTGLTVVDTASFFTVKGQVVIMLLIQLGGLNIISFATFFATLYRQSTSLRYQSLLKELLSVEGFSDTRDLLRRIFYFSISIEAIGCFFIYFVWGNQILFEDNGQKIFFSVFHAISAFNNAGFSLFPNGLYEPVIRNAWYLHIVIAVLIFFGGIGFLALEDLISIRSIRDRIRNPWKKISVNTKIVLFTSLALILFGAVMFYLLEKNNTLKGMDVFGTIVTCLFQSITPRTAGFNTVDFSHLLTPTLLIIMFLMFIGASPGSTGGGIKTTTFAVIVKSALATISGKKTLEFFRQSIREEAVGKAYAIVLFSMSLIFISTLLLTITEPDKGFLQLVFEEISAFGTVGLSTGITPLLSEPGKIILIFTMFVGRIGTLTLALIFSRKVLYTKYRYATTYLQIG